MARCGCSGGCNCKVQAGAGAGVTGTGTPSDPYVITATTGGGGVVETIVAGDNITVDDSDPANPIVASTASGGEVVTITDNHDGTFTITAA